MMINFDPDSGLHLDTDEEGRVLVHDENGQHIATIQRVLDDGIEWYWTAPVGNTVLSTDSDFEDAVRYALQLAQEGGRNLGDSRGTIRMRD